MRFVFASYVYTAAYDKPQTWLDRIDAYAQILQELAIENEVISIEQINFEGNYFNKGVHHQFRRYSKIALRFFAFKMNWHIKNLNADIIVIQGFHKPLQIILLRLIIGKKTKIIVQNRAEKPFKGYKKILQQIADRGIKAYFFTAKPMGTTWVKHGHISSTSKIHEVMCLASVFYPMEKGTAKKRIGINETPIFLWVGRLNANKDPLTVIKAFLRFIEVSPTAKLYMVYQTIELLTEIKNVLNFHPNQQNVILIGEIPHIKLLDWFNSADFLISGSHYEGGGLAISEAISCGCIPIVTDIFSFRMITNNGECGFLYETGNQEALLNKLIETKNLDLEEKRAQCLAYFQAKLSATAIAKRIQEIANSL